MEDAIKGVGTVLEDMVVRPKLRLIFNDDIVEWLSIKQFLEEFSLCGALKSIGLECIAKGQKETGVL